MIWGSFRAGPVRRFRLRPVQYQAVVGLPLETALFSQDHDPGDIGLPQDIPGQVLQFRIENKGGTTRVVDVKGQLGAGQAPVQRDHHQPQLGRSHDDLEVFRAVVGQEGDPVARGAAQPGEPVSQTVNSAVELFVGESERTVDNCFTVPG